MIDQLAQKKRLSLCHVQSMSAVAGAGDRGCTFCKAESHELWRCLDCGGGPACSPCVERFEAHKFEGYSCDCTPGSCRNILAHPMDVASDAEDNLHWPTPISTDDEEPAKPTL